MEREKLLKLAEECGISPGLDSADSDDIVKLVNAVEAQVIRDFGDALMRYQAPVESAMNLLDMMHRCSGAVVAWRDRHKLKKGDELEVGQLLDLATSTMEIIGWYTEPAPALDTRPLTNEERAVLEEFTAARRADLEAEGNQGLKP